MTKEDKQAYKDIGIGFLFIILLPLLIVLRPLQLIGKWIRRRNE